MYKQKLVGILLCMLFIGTSFNITLIITNTVKADFNNNLIAYWNFNEGSGTIVHDNSGNGYDGTNVGGSWVSGKLGYGLEITNTDYVGLIPSSYDDLITNALTIVAWVSWYGQNSYGSRSQIFDGRYSPGNGIMFSILQTQKVQFYIHQTSSIQSITSVPDNGAWTHIAVVFDDASDLMKVFINGQPDNTLSTTNSYTNSNVQPFIGNNHWAPSDGQWAPLNGVIDDFRIYSTALSDPEIQNLYDQGGANHPPNAPSNPDPSQGATGVDVNAEISWTCNDPDPGDTLIYDVYFGTNSNPPLVSIGQDGNSYKPMTMNYLTKYYWKIIANDTYGESTSSPVWNFTTTEWPNSPPDIPSKPSGPAAGWAGLLIEFLTSSTDSDNHQIKYGWDWNGDDIVDKWSGFYTSGNICRMSNIWDNPGTYNIKVKAKDSLGAVTSWSDIKTVIILVNYPPDMPYDPFPENSEQRVDINTNLSWKCFDPNSGDTITYNIYFGTSSNPPLKKSAHTTKSYDPGTLNSNTKYYWKIVAKDNYGASSTGPIWDFTTQSIENQPPIVDIISPEENNTVSGFANIYGTASDPNGNETLIEVDVKIDDKTWQIATGTQYWNYSWDTNAEIDGTHTIYARSYDGENYSELSVVNVTVFNPKPEIIIGNITSSFGISAEIKNIGTGTADDVSWSITVEKKFGIILSSNHTEGTIDRLDADGSTTIKFQTLRGIGTITVTVQIADVVKKATAFLLGPLVLRVTEL